MSTKEHAAIGRAIKSIYPGELDDIPDEAAGEIALKKGLWPPPQPVIDKYPHLFLETRAEHIADQHEFIAAQITKDGAIASQQVTVQHELTELPRRLEEQSELKDRAFNQQILADERALMDDRTLRAGAELAQMQIEQAKARNLDVVTLSQVRLEEEKAQIEIAKKEAIDRLDLDKRANEIRQDIEAAMRVALVDKQKVLFIQEQVLKQIEKAQEIRTSDKPQEVKSAQLEVISEVIDGFRSQLRGLLQGDNREDPPRGIEGSEGEGEPSPA